MLCEIKCDAFKTSETFQIYDGLNIILGQDSKANSIGKSTFLLAIDFAFGGNSYVDSKNKIVKLFGNHTICFAHKFETNTYYFSRSTETPDVVAKCDESYKSIGENINLKEFTDFLKKEYKLEKSELTFREIVSVYSHIAGRFETDFENPLKNEGDTSQSKGITRFEKLFPEYENIKPKAKSLELAETKAKAFQSAANYGFIKSAASSDKEAQKLISEKEELIKDLDETKTGKVQEIFAFEGKTAQEAADIKNELKRLRSKRSRLQSEIASIQKLDSTSKVSEDDLKVLQTYFPSVNLKKIQDVQSFHNSIHKIVNKECKDEEEKLNKRLLDVIKEIEELENRISPDLKDIPQTVLEEYGKKSVRIEQIEKSLEYYELKKNLQSEKSNAENELRMTQEQALSSIAGKVNNALAGFDEENKNLIFEFPSQKSYSLYRENDVGTGTKHLNLIIFDLAVLSITDVPFLIHDSYIFHELEDERVNFSLSLYVDFCKKYRKQIFIALDGQDKCNENSKAIIENAKVIHLGKGKETLFGEKKE
ncbi:MAG: DUF2326 domain-containing protein [Treponema sp.]|nr:DUF2326 domain-containing protein [Treponema sp.]